MKKKALRKDFYKEIRKSLGRFLSIFFIVALGVSFFAGIRASEPDMRLSGDEYFDERHLADVKVLSTFGLTEEDVKALKEVEGVKDVEYGYSVDAMCETKDSRKAVHVMSALPSMNRVDVEEGRLPEKADECFLDVDFLKENGYQVGDEIKLESGTDEPLTDSLKNETYRIVGAGSSPCYISFERGSSTIGTGEVSGFIIVPRESFSMEVYTECYLTVEGALKQTAFTKEYDSLVEETTDRIEDIKDFRCEARRSEIVEEAKEEIASAEKELADARKEAEQELSDALKKLTDGEKKLKDGKQELKDGQKELKEARALLNQKQKELNTAKAQYESGAADLESGKKELLAQEQELQKKSEEAQSGMKQLEEGIEAANAGIVKLDAGLSESGTKLEQIEESMQKLEAAFQAGAVTESDYQSQMEQLGQGQAQVQAVLDELQKQREAAVETKTQLEQQLSGIKEQLSSGGSAIEAAKNKLSESEKQLAAAKKQLESGQSQINSGWNELKKNEKKLKAAEKTIADSEKELADGRADYEEGKREAEEKIADGEQEIRQAKDDIADIGTPKWYIYDRDVFSEYSGYGDNADRMRAIGEVFPVLFFLVAALISLTTMTRMVEEQRTQIGTLKALGYGRLSIAGKYLGYALLATLGGSIAGVLIGEKLYPYIIVTAYKIMYPHLPNVVIPYHLTYAVMATLAAVVCTLAATVVSCYKEMAAQPAVLMRPPAPKQGKRVFLEKITFIWKRLSFTWKSTIRNLIRYKKRFFMTVFGIGGCMALILVGYGLRDSIFNIAVIQYEDIQKYNLMAVMDEDADEAEKAALTEYIGSEREISGMLDVYMKNMTLQKGSRQEEAYVFAVSDEERFGDFVVLQDRKSKERYELAKEGAILTEKMARTLGVEAGDTISIRDDDEGEYKIEITAVCENYMGHYLYLTENAYEALYGTKPEYNTKLFQLKAYEETKASDIGEHMLETGAVINVQYMNSMRDRIEEMLSTLDRVIVVLITAAGMLAFVVLYNLNNINITERRRELATIKVLGFFDSEVAAYVYRENILLTIIGAFAGCGLGYLLHQFVIVTVEVDDVMFGRNIEPKSYIIAMLFTFAFSAFVNLVMYFKLKRIDMVESLKSVE